MKVTTAKLNQFRIALRVVSGLDKSMSIEEARKVLKQAEAMGLLAGLA